MLLNSALTLAMPPPTPILLGPPEIYRKFAATTTIKADPFVDLMVANFNKTTMYTNLPKGLTENSSPTFLSTGNPCLDFFFHVVPDTPPTTLTHRLQLAWGQDPLKAFKLVCNLGGIRGTGKADREGYYTSALWMQQHHPKTLASNVASLADFGYFKDLPEILFRLLEGADARKLSRERWQRMKYSKGCGSYSGGGFSGRGWISAARSGPNLSGEEKWIEQAKRAVERYNSDPDFQFLHERVSDLFADCLKSDMKLLSSGDLRKISLAAKWCPSLNSSFDRITLLCETIARKVFPKEEYPEYEGIEDAHYAYRVRDRLRKQVLVPLRKALELPEVYIGAKDWGSLPYNRVASVAMKLYKERFLKYDRERFLEYLEKVRAGKAKIAAGALLPHQIIASLYRHRGYDHYGGYTSADFDPDVSQVAELQWRRMVEDMSKKGKLKNCLAICDVSGSMSGIPMDVSVALGILVSELSEEPWRGKLITFSQNPMLQRVEGDSLREKAEFVRRMEWGMNTDFQKVFDLLLEVAVNGNLKGDEMIKRLFVFTDMEFDQASGETYYPHFPPHFPPNFPPHFYPHYDQHKSSKNSNWETDYEAIVRKFSEKGYGDCVPEIVFWNLRDSRATPVPGNQPGVALVSGFSKNLMKLFLKEGGVVNPEAVMNAAISGKEYQKLVVVD